MVLLKTIWELRDLGAVLPTNNQDEREAVDEALESAQIRDRLQQERDYVIKTEVDAENVYANGSMNPSNDNFYNFLQREMNPANARFVIKRMNGRNHHIALKAIRNIRNGQEIFVDYGLDYILNEPDTRYNTKYGK